MYLTPVTHLKTESEARIDAVFHFVSDCCSFSCMKYFHHFNLTRRSPEALEIATLK
jgi:hypothetical protein